MKNNILTVAICLTLLLAGCASSPSPAIVVTPQPTSKAWPTATASPIPGAMFTGTPSPMPEVMPTATPFASSTLTPIVQPAYNTIFITSTTPMSTVNYIEWDADGSVLRYALGDYLAEPGYWDWWSYDLETATSIVLPKPVSNVSKAVRIQLGLCIESDPDCWYETPLIESPSGTQMVYGPAGSRGEYGTGELWIAHVDGSNQRLIPYPLSRLVTWSSTEDFLLIDARWSDWPDAYLVRVQDLEVVRLLELASLQTCELFYAEPRFSPDGKKIAFVGIPFDGSDGTCYLYEIGVDGRNLKRLSPSVGSITWSEDSRYIYVLEYHSLLPYRSTLNLYRVDTLSSSVQIELLAEGLPYSGYLPNVFPWKVAPDTRFIAYPDACGDQSLCLVQLGTIETDKQYRLPRKSAAQVKKK